MKTFIACLGTETNTFSPIPTGLQNFQDTMLYHGDATQGPADMHTAPLMVWRDMTEADGGEVVESLATFAQPAGITVRAAYEGLRDEILQDLQAALPVDLILLNMHGAMVADGYDDCEGDLLQRCRDVAGAEAIIGGELDLHCSITPQMCEAADALITYKEYPHIDTKERAAELYNLCRDARIGKTKPVMAVHDCRMVNTWGTPVEPMKAFVARMQDLEGRDGILSVSFAHGFPWGDVPCATARMLVIADGDDAKAEALAKSLGAEIWQLRHETAPLMTPYREALARAAAAPAGPVVVADVADNAGGGAPSDATFLLQEILDRGLTDNILGLYWDPMAIRLCKEAGLGSQLTLRIGGKCCRESGLPIDLDVTVEGIIENAVQPFGSVTQPIGDAVWLRAAGNVNLVLNSLRGQTFHPDAFGQFGPFGMELSSLKIIIPKSSQHFYAGFAPIATEVIYATSPGTLNTDFGTIGFTKLKTPFWPNVEDPYDS
ncbi:MAG: M81 family metallopeptidase [Alphaproteobacteria bacterium]|nr:M81 family metallopeptidase [Alphaproteobacteria bacterium]